VVVPFLVFNLVLLLVHLPRLLGTGVESLRKNGGAAKAAFAGGHALEGIGGGLQLLVLVLPFVGIVYTLARVGLRVGRRSWAWSADSYGKRGVVLAGGAVLAGLLAWAWMPGKSYTPIREGERGTFTDYVASSSTILTDRDAEPAYVPAGDSAGIDEAPSPDPVPLDGEDPPDMVDPGTTDPTTGTTDPVESPAAEPSASAEPSLSADPTLSPSAEVSP
jgi:putative peptide zinc metalloprotease protein